MLSKKEEQRSFNNGPLRDRWEQRAQNMADECKQEAERREKSALKGLHSKWTYHWSLGSNGDMSDFSKLTSRKDEDNNKPKIKFKIVPPPPKPKPEPPPPPPPVRRKTSPKPRRPKRKVEVDVFRLCWKESWMSLKPPKYLFLRARELKNRISEFAAIELTDNGKYKAKRCSSEAERTSPQDKWTLSFKQVKSPAQMSLCETNPFQWEIIFERMLVWEADIEKYSLPVWAGTWKIMNFAFRQQKHKWDQIWPEIFNKKSERFQQLPTQDELPDWGCSWKLSGPELECATTSDNEGLSAASSCSSRVTVRVEVFLPDWTHSWLLSAAPPEEDEERRQNWRCSCGYGQQIRWRNASLNSHHQHGKMMTQRRKTKSLFLMSQLDDDIPDVMEWMEAWMTPKGCAEIETDEQQDTEEEEQIMNEAEEYKDEVCNTVNIETCDEEEEKDEGVVEEEEDEEKEDEEVEENEVMENVAQNEDNEKERDGGVQKKIRQLDIDKEYEEDEGVDEAEEGEEEDEEYEKEEDINVEEEKKKDEEDREQKDKEEDEAEEEKEEEEDQDEVEEDIAEEDRNNVQIEEDEEEENNQDEEEDREQRDEEEDREQRDEEEDNEQKREEEDVTEEEINNVEIEEDEDEEEEEEEEEENDQDEEEIAEENRKEIQKEEEDNKVKGKVKKEEEGEDKESDMDEVEEGEDEELNIEVKNNVEEDKEENEKEDDQDVKKTDGGHEVEEEEEEDVKGDENQAAEKEKKKNQQRQVKDTPLQLQFHKLNSSFSSWRKSWMVAVAHRGGQDEDEDEEEQLDLWAWKESWRIYGWKKPDEDEVVCFCSGHRFQRHVGLTHTAEALPWSEWAVSWQMKAAVREEDDDDDEETDMS